MRTIRLAAAAAAVVVLTVSARPASATTGPLTVFLDPMHDVALLGLGYPAPTVVEPRIDLLDGTFEADTTAISAVIHVVDLDGPTASLAPEHAEDYQFWTTMPSYSTSLNLHVRVEQTGVAGDYTVGAPFAPACHGPATVTLDTVANTVTVSVATATLNGCAFFAAGTIGSGFAFTSFRAQSSISDVFRAPTFTGSFFRATDSAGSELTYTVSS